jgi:hypothetical protein
VLIREHILRVLTKDSENKIIVLQVFLWLIRFQWSTSHRFKGLNHYGKVED